VVIPIAKVRATREMSMMHVEEIAVLRTRLRDVNMEYSALVRKRGGEDSFVKMDELRARRQALMALIAKAVRHPPLRALPGQAAPDAVVQAA
jgi:hypothetical protein